jgi:hypothetical protein
MDTLIQKLHPAQRPGHRLTLSGSGAPLLSRQGDWNGGSPLHCVAMALAMLGKLSDPARLALHQGGPEAAFWSAWPHYLHGVTLSEFVSFVWELNAGVRPVAAQGTPVATLSFCERELAKGWPVIVSWRILHPPLRHAALANGVEGLRRKRAFSPHALLLDPAEAEPTLAAFNARLELGKAGRSTRVCHVTAAATGTVTTDDAVSIRLVKPPP